MTKHEAHFYFWRKSAPGAMRGLRRRQGGEMKKRHEAALMDRLDRLGNVGWVEIERWQLYLWYGAERITKGIYRDIRKRCPASDEDGELHLYDGGARLLLVKGDRLETFTEALGEVE